MKNYINRPIILDVEELRIKIGNRTRVKDFTFKVFKGEIMAIVGESGSGKTLLAKALLGLLPHYVDISAKKMHFYDEDELIDLTEINSHSWRQFRGLKIAQIFQDPMTSLNPSMKCGAQIKDVLLAHNICEKSEVKAYVFQLLKKVGIKEIERVYNVYPAELSGGQKQRVMIAIAIACKPDIIIADEPTTALDSSTQKLVIELLQKLQIEENTSVIFITHDLSLVSKLADYVLVVNHGEVIEYNNTLEIFKNPVRSYTKALLACRPNPNINLRYLPTIEDFHRNQLYLKDDERITIEDLWDAYSISADEMQIEKKRKYSQKPLMKVQNLNISYKTKTKWYTPNAIHVRHVLKNISFDIYPGEIIGIVGESGAGKSTIAKAISGLIPVGENQIVYKDIDLGTDQSRKSIFGEDIQIVLQNPFESLPPHQSIGKTLLEPLIAHNKIDDLEKGKDQVFKLLEEVGLKPNTFEKFAHQLSGGQNQRVAIARALILKPKLIIFDEAVSALDLSKQAKVLNLITTLQRTYEFAALFISHDLSIVKHMSDKILVIQNGTVVEENDAEKIFLTPKHEFTKKLIHSIPRNQVIDIINYQEEKRKYLLQQDFQNSDSSISLHKI